MRRIVAPLFLFCLMALLLAASARLGEAQFTGSITISADGTIDPSTAPLEEVGNVCSLTHDITGTITVNNNNMTLDGNNHTLTVPSIFDYGITVSGSNITVANFTIIGGAKGIDITGTSNVIANNTIKGTDNGIYAIDQPTAAITLNDASSNLITGNYLESNTVGISLVSWHSKQCTNNQIVENNFTKCSGAILLYDSSNNSIYHNYFFNNDIIVRDNGYYAYSLPSFNVWDDGNQFGNYWSDYLVRYPNSTEIDNSGVGDTPYFVKPNPYVDPATCGRQEAKDYWTNVNALYANNTDHYPLMQPFIVVPTPTPTTEPFPAAPVIAASAVTVAATAAGLLVYFKKRMLKAGVR